MKSPQHEITAVTKSMRAVNFAVDATLTAILPAFLKALQPNSEVFLLYALLTVCYYSYFEAQFGKTPGKYITGTKVVSADGSTPSFVQILLRSVLRLNPLDIWSYLFGNEQGTHDWLSNTRLIKNLDPNDQYQKGN